MGGMAEIFLGKAMSIGGIEREVAIKRVLPSLTKNTKFIEMFLDEARLSMLLTHANIVQVFDVGRSGGTYFIVMEYVDGFNLRRVFQKASEIGYRLPVEIACFVVMEVCKGLAAAHERTNSDGQHLHIVHRDLSPPNILCSRSGEVKITDFGLAKALTHVSVTDPGIVKGKFSYLSPEAADGKPVDHRADIFALGICLWELLANRRLFLGKDDMETVELVRTAEVPSLSSLNPGVSPDFERIVARALTRDPRKRYTTAHEFGDAVAGYLFKNNLKVTSYELGATIKRLFDSDTAVETPEERIGTMIQEEILNLSMLGQVNPSGEIDGSRPLDASSLSVKVRPRFDLEEFWTNAGLTGGPPGAGGRSSAMTAMESAKSPDQLVDMLEGPPSTQEKAADARAAEAGGSGGAMKVLFALILLVAIGGAVVYFMFPELLGLGTP